MDHMMGLDIIGWLNVVGVSHMMDRGGMDSMMYRSMDCMMYRGCMGGMMYRGRNSVDSMNGGGGDGLVVHRSSVQSRVN